MNPGLDETQLRELAWRRPLTADELTRLAECLREQPELRAEWQADLALASALRQLPRRPAPSNLTARILAEVDRLESTGAASPVTLHIWGRWLRWSLGVTVATVVLGGGLFWRHQQQLAAAKVEPLAKLVKATKASSLPSREALENFDVIMKLHPEAQADMQLLALSQRLAEFEAKR